MLAGVDPQPVHRRLLGGLLGVPGLAGQDRRLPAAGRLTQFDGDPGIALCLPHGHGGAILVDEAVFTT